jgi:4-amino-4-deoxy-L-arabinose transferase-like glycosyltransferase
MSASFPAARAGSAREPWLVLLVLFAGFACTAWIRPLTLPDEGRYVGVAWEMLREHQWTVPKLDGLPYFHKPILFYWLAALAMKVFGASEWAARVPSMIGATMGAWGLYLFVRRWRSEREARWAALVLATMPFWLLGAQFANLDMLVAGCISATVLLGAHAMLLADEGRPYRSPLVAAYAFAGLGVLAKGLIGGVLPAAVFIVWLLVARRPMLLLKMFSFWGLLAFLAVAGPWMADMQLRYPQFFNYFIIYHHFKRFAASGFNNPQPFWFYPVVIFGLALPSSLAVFFGIWRVRDEAPLRKLSITTLMWCWFAVIVVFFSLPKSKLVGYVLPAVPPFAWLVSRVLVTGTQTRWAKACAAVGVVVSVAVVIGVAMDHRHSTRTLGQVLRTERHSGEPLIFIDHYPYDLPFYARMTEAPKVVYDWRKPDIAQHDDWHKELYDASTLFDPAAGAQNLIGRDALPTLLCGHDESWIVATPDQIVNDPLLHAAAPVASTKDVTLWRLRRSAVSCGGTPSAGSTDR